MNWGTEKLSYFLKQYRIEHIVQDGINYKQVTISKNDGVKFRGIKNGKLIGRKRQFIVDLDKYPKTLMFVRQGVQDGSIGIAPYEVNGCIVTENMPMFSIENIDVDYLSHVLQSLYFKNEVSKIKTTGSAQKSIHERQLLNIQIPFPILATQKEIVKTYSKKNSVIIDLSTEQQRQTELLKILHQQILHDAIQGKLIPQNPKDEPASVLLEKINSEKEKLIKEGKLKTQKTLPPIKGEEIPFEIPENWAWCRLGESIDLISGQHIDFNDYNLQGIGFAYLTGPSDFGKIHPVITRWTDKPKVFAKRGDILITVKGAGVGKINLCNIEQTVISRQLMAVRPITIEMNYVKIFLENIFEKLQSEKKGTGIPGISRENISEKYFPLPPLKEQKRIVNKVEALLKTCDDLENEIKQNQELSQQLLQSALKETLEPKVN